MNPHDQINRDYVQHYLKLFRTKDVETAFYGLIDGSPDIVPFLHESYLNIKEQWIQKEIIRVLAHFRLDSSLTIFESALDTENWKTALDALVSVASPGAIEILERNRSRKFDTVEETEEFQSWLIEGIEQSKDRTPIKPS